MSGIVDLLRELAEFGERLSQGPSGGFKFGPVSLAFCSRTASAA